MDYMLRLPSPSYFQLRYVDWVRPYVNEVANHLSLTDKKKEEVATKMSLCNLYLDDLDKRKKPMAMLMMGEVGEKRLVQTLKSSCDEVEVRIYTVPVQVV